MFLGIAFPKLQENKSVLRKVTESAYLTAITLHISSEDLIFRQISWKRLLQTVGK